MPYRLEERKFLKQRLLAGDSILMLAMRRTGKTWLCHRLEDDAAEGGYTAAFCNLEGCNDETAAFSELCGAVEPQRPFKKLAKDRVQEVLGNVAKGKADASSWKDLLLRTDWRESLRRLLSVLNKDSKPWVVVLDELPLFVMKLIRLDRARAANFLSQLRAFRHEFPNVRWLVTGSVGLDVISRREKLGGTINDLERFDLQPLTRDAARRLIANLNSDGECPAPFHLGEAAFDHFVMRLTWLSPYYIKRLAVEIRPTGESLAYGPARHATTANVDRAFEALLSNGNRGYFAAWPEHIEINFEPVERQRILAILSFLSARQEGATIDTLLSVVGRQQPGVVRAQMLETLDMLGSDGYLECVEGRYRFLSGLIRSWWARWMPGDGLPDGEA